MIPHLCSVLEAALSCVEIHFGLLMFLVFAFVLFAAVQVPTKARLLLRQASHGDPHALDGGFSLKVGLVKLGIHHQLGSQASLQLSKLSWHWPLACILSCVLVVFLLLLIRVLLRTNIPVGVGSNVADRVPLSVFVVEGGLSRSQSDVSAATLTTAPKTAPKIDCSLVGDAAVAHGAMCGGAIWCHVVGADDYVDASAGATSSNEAFVPITPLDSNRYVPEPVADVETADQTIYNALNLGGDARVYSAACESESNVEAQEGKELTGSPIVPTASEKPETSIPNTAKRQPKNERFTSAMDLQRKSADSQFDAS